MFISSLHQVVMNNKQNSLLQQKMSEFTWSLHKKVLITVLSILINVTSFSRIRKREQSCSHNTLHNTDLYAVAWYMVKSKYNTR